MFVYLSSGGACVSVFVAYVTVNSLSLCLSLQSPVTRPTWWRQADRQTGGQAGRLPNACHAALPWLLRGRLPNSCHASLSVTKHTAGDLGRECSYYDFIIIGGVRLRFYWWLASFRVKCGHVFFWWREVIDNFNSESKVVLLLVIRSERPPYCWRYASLLVTWDNRVIGDDVTGGHTHTCGQLIGSLAT